MLLQSRGLKLTQQEIRSYRPQGQELSEADKNRMLKGGSASVMDIGGIVTRTLPNTALVEKKYSKTKEGDANDLEVDMVAKDVRKTVERSLNEEKSPLVLNIKGQNFTVIGFDKKNDTLIYIDSNNNYKNPNMNNFGIEKRATIKGIVGKNDFSLSHLVNVNAEDPNKTAEEIPGVEYIDKKFQQNDGMSFGIQNKGNYIPKTDGQVFSSKNEISSGAFLVSTTMKMPKQLVVSKELEANHPVVEKTKNDEQKIELKKSIRAIKKDSPQPTKDTLNKADYAKHVYYDKVLKNLDEMTPWQVKNAFNSEVMAKNVDSIMKSDSFNKVFDAMDKNSPNSFEKFGEVVGVVEAEKAEKSIQKGQDERMLSNTINNKKSEPNKEEIKREISGNNPLSI